jgi:Protein of unknown function (DUF998)
MRLTVPVTRSATTVRAPDIFEVRAGFTDLDFDCSGAAVSATVEIAGAVALAGVAGAVCALTYLHVAPTGLSPVRNAVSQYGISPYRLGYRLMTISMAVSGAAVAIALVAAHVEGIATVVTLLAVFAIARLVISWFPMDQPGTERTSTGSAHGLLAIATFVSASIAAIRLCRALQTDAAWSTIAGVSRGLGWAMSACIVLMVLSRGSPELRRGFGAVERLLYVAIISWLVVLGVAAASGQL